MLKYYTFKAINESNVDNNGYTFDVAVKAVMDKGLGKPDHAKFLKSKDGKWNLAVLMYDDVYDGDKYIYSYESGKILNDEPVNKIEKYNGLCNYLIVSKYIDPNEKNSWEMDYNFLDERGFTLKTWLHRIYGEPDENGYHIMIDREGYNLIDVNGERVFKDPKDNIEWFDDYLFCEDDSECILFDKNGKIVLEGNFNIEEYEYSYYTDLEERIDCKFYKIEFDDNICLYDSSMNIMVEQIDDDINQINNFYYVSTDEKIYNIIGPDDKMIFGNDPYSKDGWIDSIEERPEDNNADIHLVERDGEYNLFDGRYLNLVFDEWYDDIQFVNMDYIDIDVAAAVMKDGECNFYILDPESDKFKEFLFNEPVEDIKTYEDFMVVTKDGQDYLVWRNSRLMMVEFDKIWKTEDDETYTIMVDDKFDFINTSDDQTFCEKFMNGEKFDACMDLTSYYPLVEYKGKYSYIDTEGFKPFLGYKNHNQMVWFDDAEPYEDADDGGFEFHVVIDGEQKRIDEYGDDRDDPEY